MHTNKGGNPVFFCKLLFCSVRWFWFYHSSCPLSCLFPKTANLPLVGDVPLLFFWSWLQHTLRPHPFDGMSPPTKRQSEFPVTSQLFISVIHSKKNLWSPPCPLLHFSDHFLTAIMEAMTRREKHISVYSFTPNRNMRKFGLRFQRLIIVSCLLRQTPACTQKVQIHSMTYFAKSLLFNHSFGALRTRRKDASHTASSLDIFPPRWYSVPVKSALTEKNPQKRRSERGAVAVSALRPRRLYRSRAARDDWDGPFPLQKVTSGKRSHAGVMFALFLASRVEPWSAGSLHPWTTGVKRFCFCPEP